MIIIVHDSNILYLLFIEFHVLRWHIWSGTWFSGVSWIKMIHMVWYIA